MLCEECGLPMVECNALAMARRTAYRYMREHGYHPIVAMDKADILIPNRKRK